MANDYLIPSTYEQWRHCIEVRCKVPLTQDFISKRLSELQSSSHPSTKEFEKLYGTAQLKRTIGWFRQASADA